MTVLPLNAVADVIRGVSFDKAEARSDATAGYVPVLRAGNIGNRLDLLSDLIWIPDRRVSATQRLRSLDIVMCASSGSAEVVGKSASIEMDWGGSFGAFCVAIRAKNGACDPRYLQLVLRSPDFRAWARRSQGINIKNIKKSELEAYPVPTPPLDEQRRIVDLLSRAASLKWLAEQAREKTHELIPALFLDTFGDPVANPKGWPVEPLRNHVSIEARLYVPNAREHGEMSCIGPDSIEKRTGRLLSRPSVAEVKPISGKYEFQAGEVLYSKIRPALAKATLANEGGFCSADMYPLRCDGHLDAAYLLSYLLTPHFTGLALEHASRAQMPKINRAALFSIPIPLPPIELQRIFSRRMQEIVSIGELAETAAYTAEATNASLMSRLFAGS